MAFQEVIRDPTTRSGGIFANLSNGRLYITADAYRVMDKPSNVKLLVDTDAKLFAVQPTIEGGSKLTGVAGNAAISIPEASLVKKYKVQEGRYAGEWDEANKMIVFDYTKRLEPIKRERKNGPVTTKVAANTKDGATATAQPARQPATAGAR